MDVPHKASVLPSLFPECSVEMRADQRLVCSHKYWDAVLSHCSESNGGVTSLFRKHNKATYPSVPLAELFELLEPEQVESTPIRTLVMQCVPGASSITLSGD